MAVLRLFVVFAVLCCTAGCGDRVGEVDRLDGGFRVPDLALSVDSGVPDSGSPPVSESECSCNPGCAAGLYCGRYKEGARRRCGCLPPGGHRAMCDPAVEGSCVWPFRCAKARTAQGTTYLCSDGREGTPCSKTEDICNTSRGCICASTPLGTACSCQGYQGPSPLLCDPLEEMPCPQGTCVRVEAQLNPYWICSDGTDQQPCDRGQMSCVTALGCTCPLVSGREICRCSEPGTVEGYPCDQSVSGSCVDGLICARTGDALHGVDTVCSGTDEEGFPCVPGRQQCPPGQMCAQVAAGEYRCQPEN